MTAHCRPDPQDDLDLKTATDLYCLAHESHDPIMTTVRKMADRVREIRENKENSANV